MEYAKIFKELYNLEIKYLICGGLAVNIYGIPRVTADIDIIIDFEKKNIELFLKAIENLGYKKSIPVKLTELTDPVKRESIFKEKNLIAYSFYHSINNFVIIDVLLRVPLSFQEMWSEKETRILRDFTINLISKEHLIQLKKFSDREQDKKDLILLSELIKNDKKN